jgi:hypothetical protein
MVISFQEVDTFGQELLTALGVVALRAGQLDDYFCFFLSGVLGHKNIADIHVARALFFATRSSKARYDMARAAVYVSKMSDARKDFALSLLDRAEKVTKRRNYLIHGQITHELSARKGGEAIVKQVLINFQSATEKPRRSRPIKFKEVEELANEYETLKSSFWDFYHDVVVRPAVLASGQQLPSRGTPD